MDNSVYSCSHLRNICVLAHVDHGKTTMVDCLLASNGIITQRMAGKLRYMDSRPDEQERGITMKSSSISLIYKKEDGESKNYMINVIDSPGHVDFFGEVSTALCICDGCIILVDVIEGVCSQTRAALQQAWLARIRPLLVLNKIDRLFIERKLSPLDIYIHLTQTLEQVNAFVGELFSSEVLNKMSSTNVEPNCEESTATRGDQNKKQVFYDWSSGFDDVDDSTVYFSPENNNVLFASAIDGWAFSVTDFARFLSKSKLGFSENVLRKTLWGDFYLNSKEKRIQKGAQSKAKKPLFVTLVLENMFRVYEKFVLQRDKAEMIKMAELLGVKLSGRDLNHSDHKTALTHLFSQWLPLSRAVLGAVCQVVPSPSDINSERVERIMCANEMRRFDTLPPETQALKQAFLQCRANTLDSPTTPLIVCISKMFSFDQTLLPQFRSRPLTLDEIEELRNKLKDVKVKPDSSPNEDSMSGEVLTEETLEKTVFIGFARVFSGSLKVNDWVYVLGPKHDPSKVTPELIDQVNLSKATLAELKADQHVTRAQVKDLYLLMGRDLQSVKEVHAGHICGIGGLEAHVIKSATLSTTLYCPPFVDYFTNTIPILRVAVEPQNPADMPVLIRALRMLNQADPCVDVKIQETGEHVIIATGEVHLQRCIVDLENFLGEDVLFNISEPIVPFRETVIDPPKVDMLNENISDQRIVLTNSNKKCSISQNTTDAEKVLPILNSNLSGVIEQTTPNKKFVIRIRAKQLPENVVLLLEKNRSILTHLMQFQRKNVLQDTDINWVNESSQILSNDMLNAMRELRSQLELQFKEAGWPTDTVDKIWSVGPKFSGSNILINNLSDLKHRSCFVSTPKEEQPDCKKKDIRYQYENSFINGFQLCTQAGPLCDEPMMGVAFFVEQWHLLEEENSGDSSDPFGPLSGQIMSTVKECCRRAFQAQPQRLMAAMFSCIIQINSEVLGKMYAVLGRRHGRILHADLQEGSQTFTVSAVLPVVESFDFANEIRKQTSGKAIPQLSFSHWEVIETDPFWTPTTQEEYTHYGEKADTENRALHYMNSVRRRKGLHVEEKIVEHAEKQRNLTRNK